jgi:hypothetical protein
VENYHFGELEEGEEVLRGVGGVKLLLDLLFFDILACFWHLLL